MTFNEGGLDRTVRIAIGVVALGAAWIIRPDGAVLHNAVASVSAAILGGIALATGLAGWCPLYNVLHLSTKTHRPA